LDENITDLFDVVISDPTPVSKYSTYLCWVWAMCIFLQGQVAVRAVYLLALVL